MILPEPSAETGRLDSRNGWRAFVARPRAGCDRGWLTTWREPASSVRSELHGFLLRAMLAAQHRPRAGAGVAWQLVPADPAGDLRLNRARRRDQAASSSKTFRWPTADAAMLFGARSQKPRRCRQPAAQ